MPRALATGATVRPNLLDRGSDARPFVAAVCVSIGAVSGAAPLAAQACGHSAADSVAVHHVATGIVEADNARNLADVLDHYADDAVLHPPGEAAVRGRAAIRPRYVALFDAYDPAILSEVHAIDLCGELAVVSGRNGGVLRSRSGGADRVLNDAWVMTLGKQDGRWAIQRLIWHPDRDAETPERSDPTPPRHQPIIDVHLHAYPGLPPVSDPMWEVVPEAMRDGRPASVAEHRARTLAALDEHGIVLGLLSGPVPGVVETWADAAPGRFMLGAWLFVPDQVRPQVDELRSWFEDGPFAVLGELNLQYDGVAFDDERLMPYYAMAEELGVPVGVHATGGPPGTPYFHAPRFRIEAGDPLRLEPVLLRFPDLEVVLMHAGHPFLERTKALMGIYPQVYVDTGVLGWAMPRAEFYGYLRALVDAGFDDRILFGSDQVFWPEAIGESVEAVREAPFLSEAQKRAIFYDNAARLLELPDSVQARHAAEARPSG